MSALVAAARALDEYAAKALLKDFGVPCIAEELVETADQAVAAAVRIGYPVALKGCAEALSHKTELGLVALGLASAADVRAAARRLTDAMQGHGRLLVQAMVHGQREFLVGMTRDPQFGPVVTFGLGGVFAEELADVSLRVAPVTEADAQAMLDEIRAARLLGPVRGLPPVNRSALVRALVGVSRLALARPEIREVDINPLVVAGADPIAVDALVVLDDDESRA
jgi:acetate---CoA ligase (ADP-forming)